MIGGGGNILYLDRHNVACAANEIMTGFHLYRPTSSQISYEYRCVTHSSIESSDYIDKRTPYSGLNSSDGTNSLDRLNALKAICDTGYALNRFVL